MDASNDPGFKYPPIPYPKFPPVPVAFPPTTQELDRTRSPSVSSVDSQSTTSSLNRLAADLSLGSIAPSAGTSAHSSRIPPLELAAPPPLRTQFNSSSTVGEYIPPPQAGVHGPAKKKSHSKPKPEGHVPRPRNAFILFRTDVHARNLIKDENKHGKISQIVAEMWKNLPPEGKAPYQRAFEREKAEHKRLYPNYDYQPKAKKGSARALAEAAASTKPPKRQQGSKAALKAQAAQAAREAREKANKEMLSNLDSKLAESESDEDERGSQSQSDSEEDEYNSSSSASNKRSRNSTSRRRSPPKRNSLSSHSSSSSSQTSSGYTSGTKHSHDWESLDDRSQPYLRQPGFTQQHPQPRPLPPHRRHSQDALEPLDGHQTGWYGEPTYAHRYPQYQPPSRPHLHSQRYPSGRELDKMRSEQGFVVGIPRSTDSLSPSSERPGPMYHTLPSYNPDAHRPPPHAPYSTYSDYHLPPQLASSSSSTARASFNPDVMADSRPGSSSRSRQMLPPANPPAHQFLPTSEPSPITPGFPNIPLSQRRNSSLRKEAVAVDLPEMPFTPGFQSFLETYPPSAPEPSPSMAPLGPPLTSLQNQSAKKDQHLGSLYIHKPLQPPPEETSNHSSPESVASSSNSSRTAIGEPSMPKADSEMVREPLVRPSRPAHADWNMAGEPIFVPPPPSNQIYPPHEHPYDIHSSARHSDHHHHSYQPHQHSGPSSSSLPYEISPEPHHSPVWRQSSQSTDHHEEFQPPVYLSFMPPAINSLRRKPPPGPLSFPSSGPHSPPRSLSPRPSHEHHSHEQQHPQHHSSAGIGPPYHLSSERTPTQASFEQHQRSNYRQPYSYPHHAQQYPQHPQHPQHAYHSHPTQPQHSHTTHPQHAYPPPPGHGAEEWNPSEYVPFYEGPEWNLDHGNSSYPHHPSRSSR